LARDGRQGDSHLVRELSSRAWGKLVPEQKGDLWEVANAVPIIGQDVADFHQIAALSTGVPLLGVLKADADHMGLIISHGLPGRTFAIGETLSRAIHWFFGPYLNELAQELTAKWRQSLDEEKKEYLDKEKIDPTKLESIFYVVYAGGDDLFLLGPWDWTVRLALRLAQSFKEYTCRNPVFSLSAGLIFVKPHFPVHQFARLAEEALKQAKEERNRLCIWGTSLPWVKAQELMDLGEQWYERIRKGKLRRSLLGDLVRLSRQYRDPGRGRQPMFTPQLYYMLVRRLPTWSKNERDELAQRIKCLEHIEIPATWALWKTRRI
ncbi:MAG: hypothetical protein J7M05_06180, partial [Anaerolineae bacterium]|nr:hypothetical protein [Anaerolineae bacterium]